MEFRLTYAGPLYATQRDPVTGQADKRRDHKHELRQAFHPQLRRLWEITPALDRGYPSGPEVQAWFRPHEPEPHSREVLSRHFAWYGWNFVPLVTSSFDLLCGLDILFLRPDRPGQVVQSGDIDNRLKTLFDAFRVPVVNEDYVNLTPSSDEQPFYCVLEEDRLITNISVETDQLLEPVKSSFESAMVRLVITVQLRPFELTMDNIQSG